ncbi:MAG: gamma-glutamyltransferase [Alphaproteobacteria bacterium]
MPSILPSFRRVGGGPYRTSAAICLGLATALALAACAGPSKVVPAPSPASGDGDTAKLVTAKRHMVSAANPLASRAGLEILRGGGSAIDAVIAIQMMLSLVEPQSSGIGGSAFLLYYDAKTGKTIAYDGRETAPEAATERLFLDHQGRARQRDDIRSGGLAVGVPGVLRMLEMAHRRHGRLAWSKLFAATIKRARDGFAVSPRLHRTIKGDRHLKNFPALRAYVLDRRGRPLAVNSILRNRPLARTLRAVATNGAKVFYSGAIARDIAAAATEAKINPGVMTVGDIAAYRAKVRQPVCAPYRVWLVCGMGPSSTGGITTLQILGILEHFDVAALKPGSLDAVHLISQASRLAYADRNRYIGDMDFVNVPVGAMLDRAYLAKRAELISQNQSMGKAKAGKPLLMKKTWRLAPSDDQESPSTSHLSVVDGAGNVAAMTTSVGDRFGSRLLVRGFILNNQLTDFSIRPKTTSGTPKVNRAGPGKRPRSSMSPTLVFDQNGKVVLTVGSPGGTRIITYVVKTVIGVLDWGLDIQRAISLPNHTNRNNQTDLESNTGLARLAPALRAMGHKVRVRALTSGLHGIALKGGRLTGGADHRREGVALGD